jgi:hypothetical protein
MGLSKIYIYTETLTPLRTANLIDPVHTFDTSVVPIIKALQKIIPPI